METPPVKPGKPAAVVAYPYAAVVARQHSHRYIVGQPISGREHPDKPILKPNESIAVCTDPQTAIPVGEEGSYRTARRQCLQAGRGTSEEPALREHPHIALAVFDERRRERIFVTVRIIAVDRRARQPRDAHPGTKPRGASVIPDDAKESFVVDP